MRDDLIMELAAHPPGNVEEMKAVKNIPKQAVSPRNGMPNLLNAIAAAKKLPQDQQPEARKQKKLPRGIGPTVDLLKVLLKQKCEAEGVAQKLIANVADLELLAADDNADIAALRGWRREVFGSDALELKSGKLALSVRQNKIQVTKL